MIENKGFITLERTILKHWCASDPNFLAVWVRLLGDANWQTKKSLINSTVVEVKRGQLIFGLNAFSEKSGVSVMKLRRIIKVLEDENMINRQKTNKYSIISIVKYDYYQSVNKPITSKQQADNIQTTTPKQSKQVKQGRRSPAGAGSYNRLVGVRPSGRIQYQEICRSIVGACPSGRCCRYGAML